MKMSQIHIKSKLYQTNKLRVCSWLFFFEDSLNGRADGHQVVHGAGAVEAELVERGQKLRVRLSRSQPANLML
jgi:hypothetical protein